MTDLKTLWGFWSVKAQVFFAAISAGLGAGWVVLNDAQKDALLGIFGLSMGDSTALVAAVLFFNAFWAAFTVALRATPQTPKV